MTPAVVNPLIDTLTIGGPKSHMLWEIYVPGDRTEVCLPSIPAEAPGMPILRNPLPSTSDEGSLQRYAEDTLELEINLYELGVERPFDYHDGFLFADLNLNAAAVSQDSYLFEVE